MNHIKLLFFATIRDRAGTKSLELDIPVDMTIQGLKDKLASDIPTLKDSMKSVLVTINREYAFDEAIVPADAEIGMFPPVSGGADMEYPTIFSITEDEIDLNDLLAKITLTSTGAAAIFTGMVRGETKRGEAHDTDYLEYEAYIPMAEAKMKQVADEIRAKWSVIEGIAIVQRIGKLYPKTPTVLIACTAAHRDTGVFEAARYGIDRLKEIVPIWKKEVSPDGQFWVEGDYTPKPGE
jgi:molybdopterin synthase catalytic subunit